MRLIGSVVFALLAAWIGLPPSLASADSEQRLVSRGNEFVAEAWTNERSAESAGGTQLESRPGSARRVRYTYLPKSEYKAQMDAYRKELSAVIAANKATMNALGQCIQGGGNFNCGRFQTSDLPDDPNIREAGEPDPAAPAAPTVTPEQAAYIASARIRLSAPKPMIGPPPEINEWGMAAVGYPLWLWAEGNLNPAPVSDSVYDLAVSLDARLVSVVFDMGDGGRVTCSNVTTRWTRSVEPGAKSPACGYVYPKPSLPDGSYTVTANAVWAIDWAINGSTGSLPFYQSASTEIPVGELQVLIR